MSEKLDKNGLTEAEFLASYNPNKYPRPSVTADIAAITHKADGTPRIILVRRGGHPFIGTWALPGGFSEPNETVDFTAQRELFEETSVKNVPVKQLGVFSDPERDPRMRVITVLFYADLKRGEGRVKAADDAADASIFDVYSTEEKKDGKFLISYHLEGENGVKLDFTVEKRQKAYSIEGDFEYIPVGERVMASDHESLFATALQFDKTLKK